MKIINKLVIARKAMKRANSKCLQGQVGRHKLNNQAVNMDAELDKEEIHRCCDRYI